MHTCLIINDSEKAALNKSQRILAKYLPQLGPATYMGPLSAEGLASLQAELTLARSRYLSVACYLVKHNVAPELHFIVGSKRGFDPETSLYAHRTHQLRPRSEAFPGTPVSRLLAQVIRLGALTHDLGKMNKAFQQKLWRAIHGEPGKAEYIRHEAMSFFLLKRLSPGNELQGLKSLVTLGGAELSQLVTVRSAEELRHAYRASLEESLQLLHRAITPARASKRGLSTAPAAHEHVVCALISFLALTHHHLPGKGGRGHARNAYSYRASFDESSYFHPELAAQFGDCLTFEGNVFAQDAELARQFIEAVEAIEQSLTRLPPDFDQAEFVRAGLLHGRPTLVLADHLGSAMKSHETVSPGSLLANTRSTESGGLQPGDTLPTHIRNVLYHARRQTQFALNLIANQLDGFAELSTGAQRNIDLKRSPAGKFAWQSKAYEHLKQENGGRPAFVAVTAGTGSGKTIASAQVMRALSSTRFTYALGLRSLTLQTGQSYKKDLGLMDADLAVVIGDDIAKKAFEAQATGPATLPGSESLVQDDLLVVSKSQEASWLEQFKDPYKRLSARQVLGGHKIDFLAAPVVVCTVDQLIGVTQLRKVSKALQFRRIQSADLVLDEIDNYSPSELKHLASLCFMTGYARKNLVCLSATMGIQHFEALFEAWSAGLRMNHTLTGLGEELFLATLSNVVEPSSISLKVQDGLAPALSHVTQYNSLTIESQAHLPPKVTPSLLRCTARDNLALTQEVLRLHSLNRNAVGGYQASAGFIRMNTVKSARRLAKHLFETRELPEDTAMAVVCYHAKFSALELSVIDRTLNTLTNRKGLAAQQAFSAEAVDTLLAPLARANPKAKNLIIVVVTSSLIETGRDHDYDWAILEPNSHRSLIQSAGRIRRHREALSPAVTNLSIIEVPDRALDHRSRQPKATNPLMVFSRPGPFTPLTEQRSHPPTQEDWAYAVQQAQQKLGHVDSLTSDLSRDSSALGFLEGCHPDGIRNTIALQDPRALHNALAVVEQSVLHDALLKAPGPLLGDAPYASASARSILRQGMLLTDWAYLEPFRGTQDDDTWRVFLLSRKAADAGILRIQLHPVNAAGHEADVQQDQVSLVNPSRSLLCLLADPSQKDLQQKLENLLERELVQYQDNRFTAAELTHLSGYTPKSWVTEAPQTWYHPLLGFNDKEATA